MNYKAIKQLPTMKGATVHISETSDNGSLVIVKRAKTDFEETNLKTYASHILAMNTILEDRSGYPEIIECEKRLLVLKYYQHGSLDDVEDQDVLRELLGRAVNSLFTIALRKTTSSRLGSEEREFCDQFLSNEAEIRLCRFDETLKNNSKASLWLADQPTDCPGCLKENLNWFRDEEFAQLARRIAAPFLGLASHGDFGLNNVVLGQKVSAESPLVFIDTRGRWCNGVPWWDPLLDIATLITFHCRIEPSLKAYGGSGRDASREQQRLSEQEILSICRASESFHRWCINDKHWEARLQVYIAVRLLGSISTQLNIAPQFQFERASIVSGLFADQVNYLETNLPGL